MVAVRGGASALGDGEAAVRPYGRTVDLLLRLMGAPTAPSAWHPEHLSTAVVLKALVDWARATGHDFGTPGVRALALALAEDGYSDGAAPLSDAGALPLTTDLATAFVEMVDPSGTHLLVNGVSAVGDRRGPALHNRCRLRRC